MGPNLLEHMFNPSSLAVVGASDTSGSVGAQVFANILAAGFAGPVHPVNPGHAEVAGRPCFASISDMPEPVDLAVIATPAKTIPGIIHDCGEAGVRAAVVLSAGFGETGEEGQAREANCCPWRGAPACASWAPTASGWCAPASASTQRS